MNKRTWIDLIVLIFIPILIGGTIYITFRSEKLLMFDWFKVIAVDGSIDLLRGLITMDVPDWIVYSGDVDPSVRRNLTPFEGLLVYV